MAKYRLNTNVRLKNTLVIVYIVDIFEDAKETRYAVITEKGVILEKSESEIRPPFSAILRYINWEFDNWIRNNPTATFFLFGGICYLLGFLTWHILSKVS
jgi:hypothetical protein